MTNRDEFLQRIEKQREFLHLLARSQLDSALKRRVDVSGVVQQTMLEADQGFEQIRKLDEAGQGRWLRRVLSNNLLDEVRKHRNQSRDIDREQSLAAIEASSVRIEAWLATEQTSPSQHAIRNEQLIRVCEVVSQLPADQREAIELHHFQGLGISVVAERMSRTKGAVAALLFRGMSKLRASLNAERDESTDE